MRVALTIAVMAGVALPWSTATAATQRAADPVERKCGTTTAMKMTAMKKANVNSCVETDGQFMTVTAPADCFIGWGRADECVTTGTWKMFRDGRRVAAGHLNDSVPYAGPGTYTVEADVTVDGLKKPKSAGDGWAKLAVEGTTKQTLTLTAPPRALPFTISASPERVTKGQPTEVTFTVTRNQSDDDEVDLEFHGTQKVVATADTRCQYTAPARFDFHSGREPFVLPASTRCSLAPAPGKSEQVKVIAHGCFPWSFTWQTRLNSSTVQWRSIGDEIQCS